MDLEGSYLGLIRYYPGIYLEGLGKAKKSLMTVGVLIGISTKHFLNTSLRALLLHQSGQFHYLNPSSHFILYTV
jgi:hypothetical protein